MCVEKGWRRGACMGMFIKLYGLVTVPKLSSKICVTSYKLLGLSGLWFFNLQCGIINYFCPSYYGDHIGKPVWQCLAHCKKHYTSILFPHTSPELLAQSKCLLNKLIDGWVDWRWRVRISVIGNIQKAQGSFAINHGFLQGFLNGKGCGALLRSEECPDYRD